MANMVNNMQVLFHGLTSQHQAHGQIFEGQLATVDQAAIPCSQEYLDDILNKVTKSGMQADSKSIAYARFFLPDTLTDCNIVTAHQVQEIVRQCHRLEQHPELYPSDTSRVCFRKLLSGLLREIWNAAAIRSSLGNVGPGVVSPYHFHPRRLDTGLPWNKWLDNSATSQAGWIAVQQKIPKVGMGLLTNLYGRYNFEQQQSSMRGEIIPVNVDDQLPAACEAFQHMTWFGFLDVPDHGNPLGFPSGNRGYREPDRSLTLETLSAAVHSMRGFARVQRGSMLMSYFRWAAAYQPL